MEIHITLSVLASVIALFVAITGLLLPVDHYTLLPLEITSLVILLVNSLYLTRWVFKNSNDNYMRLIALFCLISLLLCLCGDFVNFNLSQQYYLNSKVIKHSYLVESIMFFAPGYTVLLLAVFIIIRKDIFRGYTIWVFFIMALGGATSSFYSMFIPQASAKTLILTWLYSFIITCIGLVSVLLVNNYGGKKAPIRVWVIGIGLIFAAVADGLIGYFWIFGNNGEGYYPHIRYVNWVFYIISQSIVVHLPKLAVEMHKRFGPQ